MRLKQVLCLALGVAALMAVVVPQVWAASPTWNLQAATGDWDTTTGNWTGGSPDDSKYVNGDDAAFGSYFFYLPPDYTTVCSMITVNVTPGITPNSMTVKSDVGGYTFTGSGINGGAGTLAISGATTTNFYTSNTFGTVNLGASGSAGAMYFYAPNSFHNVNIISGNVYIYDSGAMGGSSGTITLPGPGAL